MAGRTDRGTEDAGRRSVVTGGAGFIGSHLVEVLVEAGHDVTVVDTLQSGDLDHLAAVQDRITMIEGDCGDATVMDEACKGQDTVWHLAADPDVRGGEADPVGQYERNMQTTMQVLESMRWHDVPRMRFTSTSTVYGEATVHPTPEDYGPLLPISIYGASKLAGEAMVSAYAGTYGTDAQLYRFANVVGPRARHGVIVDFVRKLQDEPTRLQILGDGTQTKSYVHVQDTVDAMMHADRNAPAGVHAFNIGTEDQCSVTELADVVSQVVVGARPEYHYTGGTSGGAGWKGDVKRMGLAVDALKALGWQPAMGSLEAVRQAAKAIHADADAQARTAG